VCEVQSILSDSGIKRRIAADMPDLGSIQETNKLCEQCTALNIGSVIDEIQTGSKLTTYPELFLDDAGQ
jgi:hypothetical protein